MRPIRELIWIGESQGISAWLAGDPDLDAPDERGIRPLQYASAFPEIRDLLLRQGADPMAIGWTPLHMAAEFGTVEDVQRAITESADTEAKDHQGFTPLELACRRCDQAIIDRLLIDGRGDEGSLEHLLLYRVGHEFPKFTDALKAALKGGDLAIVRLLAPICITGEESKWTANYLYELAEDAQSVWALVEAGLSPQEFHCCFEPNPLIPRDSSDIDPYGQILARDLKWATERPQTLSNPTRTTDTLRTALIRKYHYPPDVSWPDSEKPHWSFYRNGQSFTRLNDGRIVFVAGEHEDWYDPDFQIYNDVVVVDSEGGIEIFDYSTQVFPPTDSHSATLVNDAIYIIGSLGYAKTRKTDTPVYRLDLSDFHISRVEIEGDTPGRIFGHRAQLIDGPAILITQGTQVKFPLGIEMQAPNKHAFIFDIPSGTFFRSVKP